MKDYQRILSEMLELGPVYFYPTDPTVIQSIADELNRNVPGLAGGLDVWVKVGDRSAVA